MTDPISPDLKTAMRRLRLGKLLDTLPERVALARQQKMAHQDFLFLLLSDECQRRDSAASTTRAQRASLEPEMQLERWDPTAKVTYDQALLNELVSIRFVERTVIKNIESRARTASPSNQRAGLIGRHCCAEFGGPTSPPAHSAATASVCSPSCPIPRSLRRSSPSAIPPTAPARAPPDQLDLSWP